MSNGALKELERFMNEELKAKGLNIKVEMKSMSAKVEAYEHNLLYKKTPTDEEAKKMYEAFGIAIEKWKKKYLIK